MYNKVLKWLAISELNKTIKKHKKDFEEQVLSHNQPVNQPTIDWNLWITKCELMLQHVKSDNADVDLYFKLVDDYEVLVMSIRPKTEGSTECLRIHLEQETE